MKIVLSLLAFGMTLMINAQSVNPVVEKDGDLLKATYFHDNGEIAQVGHFLDGKLHGEWIMFDTAGKKVAIGQYNLGMKTGKWFFWDEEGLKEVDYRDSQIASVVKWNNGESIVLNK